MKNKISKMNNTLEEINSNLDEAENQTSNLGDKVAKNIPIREAIRKKNLKNMDSLSIRTFT